jgi:DNA helicase HerA-like ATPase
MQSIRTEPDSDSLLLGEETLSMDSQTRGFVRLRTTSLTRHVQILGTTGSGKSQTSKVLACEIAKQKIPITILDRTGEYVEVLPSLIRGTRVLTPGENLSIAIFERGATDDLPAHIEDRLSLLNRFYRVTYEEDLSPLQGRILRKVLFDHYVHSKSNLSVYELILQLDQFEKGCKDLHGWPESIEAMISMLWPLTVSKVGATFNRLYSDFNATELFDPGLTIIDLSVLPDDSARNLLSQVVLKEVYGEARKRGKRNGEVSLVFVIDEAHHICPNQRGYISIPERCAIELRKYGFALVTCATRPALVSPNIIANSNTLICHMLNNIDDTGTAAGFFVGGKQFSDSLRRLPVGEALVQINAPVPKNVIRCRVGTAEQRGTPGIA